ncbi:uncharacterized protein RJT21DRAFT_48323 [Scheffersomyces amazonensis]|uniref:uncharacterized protein n=1 Tax=Scheffersomyces amazonensis TaxID=1078765 RepID=UPI00315D57AF
MTFKFIEKNNILRRLQSQYFSGVINFVSFVLSRPSHAILIPSMLIFIIAYGVVYDFTIKQINSQLANHFGGSNLLNLNPEASKLETQSLLNNLNSFKYQNNSTLSYLLLSRNHEGTSYDSSTVLDYNFFYNLEKLENNLTNSFKNDITIISPLSNCPIKFSEQIESDSLINKNFKSYIIRYLNYEMNNLLTFLFVDNIRKSNHLIKYAESIKIFILHSSDIPIENHIKNYLKLDELIKLDQVITITHIPTIKGFVQYFLIQNNAVYWTKLFVMASNWIIYISFVLFALFVYLAIVNDHKIRSVVGLLLGWLTSVLISSMASVNIVSTLHGFKSWRLIFEPSTPFTKGSYVFAVLVLSTKNLFTTIKTLSDSDEESEQHKRLYKLYTGDQGAPLILRNLILHIVGLLAVYIIGSTILYNYITGSFYEYIANRLTYLIEAIVISLIFEFLLELSYLAGIVIIDLKRLDFTDIINRHQQKHNNGSNDDFLLEESDEEKDKKSTQLDGGNIISSFLLKSKEEASLRPKRGTLRYKFGQFFLRLNYSEDYTSTFSLTLIGLIQLLGIFMHWVLIIPHSVLNNSKDLIKLGATDILSNNNNFIYYLELLSILLFIVASSSIAFKLTSTDSNGNGSDEQSKLSKSDFEKVNRYFNAIELKDDIPTGHTLDVLKIATNSKSSFVVTVGLDKKILVWSPLSSGPIRPINIASRVETGEYKGKDFWPINHVSLSDDGCYIILICFKYGLIKCYERKELNFKWEAYLSPELLELIANKKFKILEHFFRKKTVPGVLARKMLLKKGQKKAISTNRNRRDSDASIMSVNSQINGNFPPPPISMKSFSEQQREMDRAEPSLEQLERELIKVEFVLVLESGQLVTFTCHDGNSKTINLINLVYGDKSDNIFMLSAKKVTTPRINDRIVCQMNNSNFIVATVVNNNWKLRKLSVVEGLYNQAPSVVQPVQPISASNNNKFSSHSTDFRSIYNLKKITEGVTPDTSLPVDQKKDFPQFTINKSTVITVDFVGMIVVVRDQIAELIDVQSGIVLKDFNVGRFKPNSFRVSHSEPTHCRFCGCASIQSFSIAYEDYDTPTLIVHTYKIELKRSKNNICLRVERDPREIRCLGFNAVTEHQYWFNGVVGWELTDVNMIIGLKKKDKTDDDTPSADEEVVSKIDIKKQSIESLIEHSGLMSLRSRSSKIKNVYRKHDSPLSQKIITVDDVWEGFIITLIDGKLINYQIPLSNSLRDTELVMSKINSIAKYGYKSIIFSVGRITDIFYLGNDTLIEDDIYYSGTNATMGSVLEEDAKQNMSRTGRMSPNPTANAPPANSSELLFINKRRKMRDKHLLSQSTT